MAKVLLVDTNFSSAPIYRDLVALGHDVYVVGNNPNDCLAKVSPNYRELDYSDVNELDTLVTREKFDFLVPGCTDRSYLSCVAVSQGRFPGLDEPDASEGIFNKDRFRRMAEQAQLPAPRRLSEEQQHSIIRPVIVKPVDAFSGKGITVLRDNGDLSFSQAISAARSASPSGQYLIEEFVEGQLHSHSAFLQDGRVVQDFIVQEDGTSNPFVVDTSRVVTDVPATRLGQLRACAESMAVALGLVDGLLHTQFISHGENIWLIETTRRCPGDLYSQLIELSTGYSYVRSYVSPFLGLTIQAAETDRCPTPILRHTVTLSKAQTLGYLHFKSPLHVERWVPLSVVGDELKPSPLGRVGILFCRVSNAQQLDQLYQAALRRELYEVHV